jgi:archaemetzincin
MREHRFTALVFVVAAAAMAASFYLTTAAGGKHGGNGDESSCVPCERTTGRSPQGAGIDAAPDPAVTTYENDVTEEPYFPGEFVFTGTSWNEVFREKGESFAVYSKAYKRGTALPSIRIIPLGLSPDDPLLVQLKQFLETAFSSQVVIQDNVPIPKDCYDSGRKQYDAGKILSNLMQRSWVHRQTHLNVAVMKDDLFAPGLNFVFGYADYVNHISVFSLARLVSKNKKLTLRRVLKIGRHEIAHMYGLVHCTSPFCVMRGVNNIDELDASTLSMCNGCAMKVSWRLGMDVGVRSAKLKALYMKKFPELFR